MVKREPAEANRRAFLVVGVLSMPEFAGSLARQTGRPVMDKTGLACDFDFDLTWSSDQAVDSGGPSIFTALQELGLRLVSTKGFRLRLL